MKAYLFPRDNFMYIVEDEVFHMYYNGKLTKDVRLSTINSYLRNADINIRYRQIDSVEEGIKEFEDEVTRVYCRDFLEIILDDSYSLKLRKETIDVLLLELNKVVQPPKSHGGSATDQ